MDLEAIKRMLLVKYPAFSGIVLNTQFIEREDVITAATDGDVVYYAYTSDIIVENKNHVYEVAAGFYFCNSHWVSVIQEEGEYWLFNDSAKPTKLNVDSLPQFVRPEGYEKDFMCVGTLFVKRY